MVKNNTIKFDEVFYTKFDSNFMWDSNGYPYMHTKTLNECKKICDVSKIKLEAIKLSQTILKEPESSSIVSRWTSEQLKEIEQEKTNNARMLEQHHKSKLEWSKQLDKI